MSSNWFHDAPAISPYDVAPLKAVLAQIDESISAAATARKQLDTAYKPGHPARDVMLAQLRDDATATVADLQQRAARLFDEAQQHASRNIATARAAFSRSDEGRSYLAALPAYAAIANALPADQLAERLNGLIDAGLVGEARAMAEAAQLRTGPNHGAGSSGKLLAALHRASVEAKTPAEVVSERDAEFIANAHGNFRAIAGAVGNRIEEAVDSGFDYAAGMFTAKVF